MSNNENFWEGVAGDESSSHQGEEKIESSMVELDGTAPHEHHTQTSPWSDDVSEPNDPKVESSSEFEASDVHINDIPEEFAPREPQELKKRSIPLFILVVPALMFIFIFAFPLSQSFIFSESCNGSLYTLGNQSTEAGDEFMCDYLYDHIQVDYSTNGNITEVSGSYGFQTLFRWDSTSDSDVIGYLQFESNEWFQYQYCEWEGDDYFGDTRWYCNYQDGNSDHFDDWWFYCEWDGVLWQCTDMFGQSEGFSNTSGEQRSSGSGEMTYDCRRVVRESRMTEFTSNEYTFLVNSMTLPDWCYGAVEERSNQSSNTPPLPFDGERVFIDHWDEGWDDGRIQFIGEQYTWSTFRYSELDARTFDSDGELITSSSDKILGVLILLSGSFLFLLLMYTLSTRKTHVMHLGSENTVVVMTSWLNKPAKVKASVPLDHTSFLRRYTSTSTDSEGHTTTSTHHEICTSGYPNVKMPDRFSGSELSEVTGLKVNPGRHGYS